MNNMLAWTELYRPAVFSEIVGNKSVISEIKSWCNSWQNNMDVTPLLLHGKPGVGKTTLAYVMANEMNWEIVELNASDQRTASVIKKIAGVAAATKSFDDIIKLIILDEADNLHGNSDKGGAKAIIDIIKTSSQPIILTANELYKISPQLRNKCEVIELKNITKTDMFIALSKICDKENVSIDVNALELLCKNSNGDLRSAISDLQANANHGNTITKICLDLSDNPAEKNIFKTMQNIFNAPDISSTYNTLFNSDKTPEEMLQWIEQNLYLKFKNDDMYLAYDKISKADVFIGRVRRRQNYKMWKYTSALLSCLNSDSLNGRYNGRFVKYQSPQHWTMLKNNKRINNMKKELFKKLVKNYHFSGAHMNNDALPFLFFLMQNIPVSFSIENQLTKDEISYMLYQRFNLNKNEMNKVNGTFEMAQHDIKLNEANDVSNVLDSEVIDDIFTDGKFKTKKSKEELKTEKLTKGQFNLDDF